MPKGLRHRSVKTRRFRGLRFFIDGAPFAPCCCTFIPLSLHQPVPIFRSWSNGPPNDMPVSHNIGKSRIFTSPNPELTHETYHRNSSHPVADALWHAKAI